MPETPTAALVAAWIRAARTAKGLSQAKLGILMGLPEDVASTRINRYETGASEPDFETVKKIAETLDIPMEVMSVEDAGLARFLIGLSALPKSKRQIHYKNLEADLGPEKAKAIRALVKDALGPNPKAAERRSKRQKRKLENDTGPATAGDKKGRGGL